MTVIPDTCETCGAPKSHETLGLLIHGCVYQCGAAVASDASGHVYPALICRKALGIIAGLRAGNSRLRADNARLGDRGVLVAIAMLAAIEGLEKSLRAWATLPLDSLPKTALLELAPLRAAYDELVDVLEGAAPTPAADTPANETCPGQSESVSTAEHVGERSWQQSSAG